MTAGVVACTGVATTALVIRRDSTDTSRAVGTSPVDSGVTASTVYLPAGELSTTSVLRLPAVNVDARMVWDALWNARNDPAGAALVIAPADQAAAEVMPTPEQFGCSSAECRAMYTYVVWHEIAKALGFADAIELQASNPRVDLSVPPIDGTALQTPYSDQVAPPDINGNETPTTISVFDGVMLIDGGAPAGAMEDAYQRLAGYDRTIVPGSGKSASQTMLMPIDQNEPMAAAVGTLLGIDGFDTWDSSFLASPLQGMVAVVVGPDYWDLVQRVTPPIPTAISTTTSKP